MNFIPLHLTIALVTGVLSARYFENDNGLYLLINTTLIILMSWMYLVQVKSYNRSRIFSWISLLLFYFIGLQSMVQPIQKNHYSKLITQATDSSLIVIQIKKELRSNAYAHRYIGEIRQVDHTFSQGTILLSISRKSIDSTLMIGENLLTKRLPEEIKQPLNPYQFNYKLYLKKRGINWQLNLRVLVANQRNLLYSPLFSYDTNYE